MSLRSAIAFEAHFAGPFDAAVVRVKEGREPEGFEPPAQLRAVADEAWTLLPDVAASLSDE